MQLRSSSASNETTTNARPLTDVCVSLASGVPSAPIQIDTVESNCLMYLRCCSGSFSNGMLKVNRRAGLPFQVSAFSALNTFSSSPRNRLAVADVIGTISPESSLPIASTVGVFAFGSRASWRDSASMRESVSFA